MAKARVKHLKPPEPIKAWHLENGDLFFFASQDGVAEPVPHIHMITRKTPGDQQELHFEAVSLEDGVVSEEHKSRKVFPIRATIEVKGFVR